MNTAAALAEFVPTLEQRFVAHTIRTIEFLVEKFGKELRGVANSTSYNAWTSVSPFYSRSTGEINHARIALAATEYANATVAAWGVKIDAKLGELDAAELVRGAGASFTLRGEKAGRKVSIEQDMIVNVSSKGTLFNQFPARIYVDGKFTPAAKFAALS